MDLYAVITSWVSLLTILCLVAALAFIGSKLRGERPSIPNVETTSETDLETVKRILASNKTPEIETFLEEELGMVVLQRLAAEQRPCVVEQLRNDERNRVVAELRESEREGVIDDLYKRLEAEQRPLVIEELRNGERDRVVAELRESERQGVIANLYKLEGPEVCENIGIEERQRLRKEGMSFAMADNHRRGIEWGRKQILAERREALRVAQRWQDERDKNGA